MLFEQLDMVIHAGAPKAGSTSIQAFLAEQYSPLLARDLPVLYPRAGRGEGVNHAGLADGFAMRGIDDPSLSALRAEIAAQGQCKVVLSMERFSHFTGAELNGLADAVAPGLRGGVVFYFRPIISTMLSQWGEIQGKHAAAVSLDEHLSVDTFAENRLRALRDLRGAFGDDLHVYRYARDHLHKGDVVQDFAARLFGPGDPIVTPLSDDERARQSPGAAEQVLIERIRPVLFPLLRDDGVRIDAIPTPVMRRLRARVAEACAGSDARISVPGSRMARLVDRQIEAARQIDQEFIGANFLEAELLAARAASMDVTAYLSVEAALGLETAEVEVLVAKIVQLVRWDMEDQKWRREITARLKADGLEGTALKQGVNQALRAARVARRKAARRA